jgi:hypothetical protein
LRTTFLAYGVAVKSGSDLNKLAVILTAILQRIADHDWFAAIDGQNTSSAEMSTRGTSLAGANPASCEARGSHARQPEPDVLLYLDFS